MLTAHGRRALSIRQPFAELILRGVKTVEFRSRSTSIIGERFWIYASLGQSSLVTGHLSGEETAKRIWSSELAIPGNTTGGSPVPRWLLELAEELVLDKLPRGVIVGSAVVEKVVRGKRFFEWHLGEVERASKLRKPNGRPQPVWFRPF